MMPAAYCPSLATYNVNGLSHYAVGGEQKLRKIKMKQNLVHLAKRSKIICVQETHLNRLETEALRDVLPGWGRFYSNKDGVRGASRSAGVMTLVDPAVMQEFNVTRLQLDVEVQGHGLALLFEHKKREYMGFQVVNVYFPQRAKAKVALIEAMAGLDVRDTFMLGDFNFVEHVEDAATPDDAGLTVQLETAWRALKDRLGLFEVHQGAHTFLRRVLGKLVSSRLDRCYINRRNVDLLLSVPSAFLPSVPHSILHRLSGGGESTVQEVGSDHTPVAIHFAGTEPDQHKSKSLPRWVFETKQYKLALQQAMVGRDYASVPDPFQAMEHFKTVATHVARSTRFLLAQAATVVDSVIGKVSVSVSLLRMVEKGDDAAVLDYITRFEFLEQLVERTEEGWVVEPLRVACDKWIADSVKPEDLLAGDETHYGAYFNAGPEEQDSASNRRLKELKALLPSSRARLPGLRASLDEEITDDPEEMAKIAAGYYSALWGLRDKPAGAGTPEDYFRKVGYNKVIPEGVMPAIPEDDVIVNIILSTNNSSAGPDGIPFCVYRAVADVLAPVFRRLVQWIGEGYEASDSFNWGLLFILPKKGTLIPADTRPLSVTNGDNRIVAKIITYAIVPAVKEVLNKTQKGFVPGRQGMDHILTLMANFYAPLKSKRGNYHCLQVDTERAFDTIDHGYILAALRAAGFPRWVINAVTVLLREVWVNPVIGGKTNVWIAIKRGVKQGCPLSPILFAIVYDALLCTLSSKCPSVEVLGFADDLNMGASRRGLLTPAMCVLDDFKEVSGLQQNVKKTCLVSARSHKIPDEEWVKTSAWKELKVALSNVYLGFMYGRNVTTEDIFRAATEKAISRLNKYYSYFRAISYSSRVVAVNVFVHSLFTYLCQVYPYPYCGGAGTGGSMYKRYQTALMRAVVPFHGTAYSYHHVVMPGSRVGLYPAVRDLWAASTATLAAKGNLVAFEGTTREEVIGGDGWGKRGPRVSLMPEDCFKSAARDVVIATFGEDSSLAVFSADVYKGMAETKRRAHIYQFLVEFGYSVEQDRDLERKLIKWGVSNAAEAEGMVQMLHANFGMLKGVHAKLRRPTFQAIVNATPTERRRMVITYPLKTVRDTIPRPGCCICGEGVDEIRHVLSECVPVVRAIDEVFANLGAPVPDCSRWSASLLCFKAVEPMQVLVMATVNKAVRRDYVEYFSSLGSWLPFSQAKARLVRVIEDEWNSTGKITGLGSAGKRTVKQTTAALAYAKRVIGRLPADATLAFTDGAAQPNPGPAGAGGAIYRGLDCEQQVGEFSIPIGVATNNIGELWAIGAALQFCTRSVEDGNFGLGHTFAILSDSKGSVKATGGMQRAQDNIWLVGAVRRLLKKASEMCTVRIIWVPGHVDLLGNTEADEHAGRGAINSANTGETPDLKALAEALNFLRR